MLINFDSVKEKEQFDELADELGLSSEQLSLRLIRDFMKLHPNFDNPDTQSERSSQAEKKDLT